MNKVLSLLVLAGALVQIPAQAQEVKGDAAKGEAKAAMCIGCHGLPRYQATFPEIYKVPLISGQGAKYIVSSLQGYAKGDRKHPTMRAIAGSLSEQDMADLGAFYESHGKSFAPAPKELARPMPEALKAKLQICVSCHGANLSAPIDPSYPKIAGQHGDYLMAALRSYSTDGNPNVGRSNAVMRSQVVQEADGKKKPVFTSAEIKQVANWIAALPGELKTVEQKHFK